MNQNRYPQAVTITPVELSLDISLNTKLPLLNLEGVVEHLTCIKYNNTLLMFLRGFLAVNLLKILMKSQEVEAKFLSLIISDYWLQAKFTSKIFIKILTPPISFLINNGQLKLTLVFATQLSRENPTISNPNVLKAGHSYISPEQTGPRMNQAIDYRSDFFILSVLPFLNSVCSWGLVTNEVGALSSSSFLCHLMELIQEIQKSFGIVMKLLERKLHKLNVKCLRN